MASLPINRIGVVGWGFHDHGVTSVDQSKGKFYKNEFYRDPELIPGPPEQYIRSEPKIHRNDLCDCGSGKKYKKCCLS